MIRFLQTPGKTKKFILAGILLFFCMTLVITLVPGIGGDSTPTRAGVLAKVDGEDITINQLQALIERYTGSRSLSGPMVDQAFRYVMQQKVMLMEADRLGFRVTDDELRKSIRKQFGSELFPNGEFVGNDKYTEFVQNQQRMPTIQEFEQDQKSRLLLNKLIDAVTAGAQVPTDDVQREFVKQNTKVKLQYAVVNGNEIAKTINPKESELKAYYDQHKALYSNPLPEKRKARYITIDSTKIQDQVKVSTEQLQQYYDKNIDSFRQPEEVKASHILIKVPAKADAKTDEAARAKAEDILKQLKAGANFADMAKKYSDDTTASQGGALPWFQHGTMVPEFDKAAFSMPPGQISGLVKTEYGYHIIKVEDKREARLKPLEEVKSTIEPQLASDEAHKQAEALATKVANLAGSQGLDPAAAQNHLEVTPSDWFARTDSLPGIGNSPDFMDAVFKAKENAPPSEVATSTGYVVFQLIGVKPSVPPTYDDVRSRVLTDYKQEQTGTLVYKKAQELSDRAHALNDLPRAAKELGAKVETSNKPLGPEDQTPGLGSMRGGASVAFSMKQGEISSPVRTESNNAAVFTVLERQEPTPADFEKSGDQIRERLVQQKRSEMLQLYTEGLQQTLTKEGKIKINQPELDTYTKRPPETSYNR